MRPSRIFPLLVLVLLLPAVGRADYLEVKRATSLYASASAEADKVIPLSVGTLLTLDNTANPSFYVAQTKDGQSGYVPRSYVQRHKGKIPSVATGSVEPWVDLGDALTDQQKAFARRHYAIGKPQALIQRVREGYSLGHDSRLKIPVWVQYELTREDLVEGVDRKDAFKADAFIPRGSRSETADYVGSGYDQGHLAPAADMSRTAQTMEESFVLSNMAPQVGIGFNRHIWSYLEAAVREWAERRGRVTVITGPVFAPKDGVVTYKVIGPNAVAVPTHFYKIVVDSQSPANVEAIAFLLPNENLQNRELSEFIVSIDSLEKLTGLDFLSALPPSVQRACEEKPAPGLW